MVEISLKDLLILLNQAELTIKIERDIMSRHEYDIKFEKFVERTKNRIKTLEPVIDRVRSQIDNTRIKIR